MKLLDYEAAYKVLFNAATDAIEEIGRAQIKSQETEKAGEILRNAQLQTEEMYIEGGDF